MLTGPGLLQDSTPPALLLLRTTSFDLNEEHLENVETEFGAVCYFLTLKVQALLDKNKWPPPLAAFHESPHKNGNGKQKAAAPASAAEPDIFGTRSSAGAGAGASAGTDAGAGVSFGGVGASGSTETGPSGFGAGAGAVGPALAGGAWTCSACTLENTALSISCAACDTLKTDFNLDILHGSTAGGGGAAAAAAAATAAVVDAAPEVMFVGNGAPHQHPPVWNLLQYGPDAGAAEAENIWTGGADNMLPRLIRATKARLLTTLSACLICDKDLGVASVHFSVCDSDACLTK